MRSSLLPRMDWFPSYVWWELQGNLERVGGDIPLSPSILPSLPPRVSIFSLWFGGQAGGPRRYLDELLTMLLHDMQLPREVAWDRRRALRSLSPRQVSDQRQAGRLKGGAGGRGGPGRRTQVDCDRGESQVVLLSEVCGWD